MLAKCKYILNKINTLATAQAGNPAATFKTILAYLYHNLLLSQITI